MRAGRGGETSGRSATRPLTCRRSCCARLGGRPHPLRRKIIAPSEKRIRTLLHVLDAASLDEVTGGWLRDLADAGRLDGLLTAIAIDGKWLRGVATGSRSSCSPRCCTRRRRSSPSTGSQTRPPRPPRSRSCWSTWTWTARWSPPTPSTPARHRDYIAGPEEDGGRGSDYFLFVKGNQPTLQRAVFDAIQHDCPRDPDHAELDCGHGRIIRRSIWVSRCRRHWTSLTSARSRGSAATATTPAGALISKEIVHAVTSLDEDQASAADLAKTRPRPVGHRVGALAA